MGHALLTKLLMPTLLKTAEATGSDVRVINLSSEAHNLAPSGGIIFDQSRLEKVCAFVDALRLSVALADGPSCL